MYLWVGKYEKFRKLYLSGALQLDTVACLIIELVLSSRPVGTDFRNVTLK